MAFANANVGLFPGAGGGGLITVSDTEATNVAAVANASYWNQSADASGANGRRRRAVEDFIALQQDGEGSTGAGVPMLIVVDGGADTNVKQARLTAAGRVTVR